MTLDPSVDQSADDVFVFPASFAQQRLWFIDQFSPGNAAYNIPRAVHFTGPLNVQALEQALNAVIERHEVLRTTFVSIKGEPHQVAKPSLRLPLPISDLRQLSEQERAREVEQRLNADANQPFDLTNGPLVRASVLRLAEQEHILLITMHHIISDGWSTSIFIRELGQFAEGFASGKQVNLPELPIQYADYAEWQREWLQGAALEQQLAYWREQLQGAPSLLELPLDHPRPAVQTSNGATVIHTLPAALTQQLQGLSRSANATLFMTLLAAFQTLLHRVSAQDDLCVGTPVANRTRAEVEGLIGFFVNTLVMRADFSDNPSFRTLLARVREQTLGAFAHQDVPFEKLVEELKPERSLSHTPLFQVMFVLQNAAPTLHLASQAGGLTMRPLSAPGQIAKFDLTLEMSETDQGLVAAFEYNTDLFAAASIERLAGHWQTLLEQIVAAPDAAVGQLSLISAAERRQVLVDWNTTASDYPRTSSIQQVFEQQAAHTPAAVAVSFAGSQLTYEQLNQRANQLAHQLGTLGVKHGSFVGVSIERSLELIVALVAILKAGGAYVPLDPTYPAERLALMLQDTQPEVLLAQRESLAGLPPFRGTTFCVDEWAATLEQQPISNPAPLAHWDSPAYVMYTSGSTGQAKGIVVPQRAVIRLVKNTNYIKLDADEVLLHFAPVAFDASTLELWGPLLNGGRIALAPPVQLSLEELAALLEREGVTTLWLTAGLFHQMVEQNLHGLRPLRQLLAGGDALSVSHVRRVLEELPECRLINGYGPTENTTFTACYQISDAEQLGNSVPIGRPIANTQVYILDRYGQPVPIGVPGELYIAGDGLAHGYLNRPDLTAAAFVAHPWSQHPEGPRPGARLYRTGDLVRYRPDGAIEFLGRIDQQVKIRGFRIEPGEIEAVLKRHAAVADGLVLARSEGPGERTLVAYVIPASDAALDAAALRQYLQTQLPAYMIPSAFMLLPEFPLTANGKVNRRALPAPERTGSAAYVAPSTPTEIALAEMWIGLLQLERVGTQDSFFELGGHSLLATQLASRIRATFQIELPLRQMFEAPTIAALAPQIDAAIAATQAAPELDLEALLDTLEGLSDEEVDALLRERGLSLDDLV